MKFHSSAVIFKATDLDTSISFYKDVLGFSDFFKFGDYAGLTLNNIEIHIAGPSILPNRVTGKSSVYIYCEGINEYYEEVSLKGANIADPIMSYDYGMRDFTIEDPDGNLITFGQSIDNEGNLVLKG